MARNEEYWFEKEISSQAAEIRKLSATLEEIRDLARTGTAAFGMSQDTWNTYKVNKIAGMANAAIAPAKGE